MSSSPRFIPYIIRCEWRATKSKLKARSISSWRQWRLLQSTNMSFHLLFAVIFTIAATSAAGLSHSQVATAPSSSSTALAFLHARCANTANATFCYNTLLPFICWLLQRQPGKDLYRSHQGSIWTVQESPQESSVRPSCWRNGHRASWGFCVGGLCGWSRMDPRHRNANILFTPHAWR